MFKNAKSSWQPYSVPFFRIIEACGNAGFLTGSFSMIAKEFPDNVATMFAILETFFGLGMIMGPTVGGALYEVLDEPNIFIPSRFKQAEC